MSVIIFVFALLILIPRSSTEPPSSIPIPPNTPISPTSPTPSTNNLETLISKLPHQTPNYTIEYASSNQTFYISIRTKPYIQYEQQAKQFIQQYFSDINQLNLKIAYF